ncbi:MAG: Ig-like domain-containing protein [bacterium]|nr:Ig-like domain-containing protein [bacterium]
MVSTGIRGFLWGTLVGMLALLASCAKVGVPPGGPEDKTGPRVAAHYPERDAVDVTRRMTARLEFSEPVNRTAVEAALFLSPDPRQRLRYRWRGRALDLIYLDLLDADRTYVISVGSQAKDLRGNPAAETYTIAFSTGSHIDRGSLRGWIGDFDTPQAVTLWAYRLEDEAVPDPLTETADYGVQASGDGTFRFDYLKIGIYRVFAVQDRNRDGLWTPPGEPIGVPPWDVIVTDSTLPWLSFKLSRQDTMPARIHAIRSVHDGLVAVRMNREIASLDGVFIAEDSDTVRVLDAYADTSGADSWNVFPAHVLGDDLWSLWGSGTDQFNELWQDTDTFEVRARPDTSRPIILNTVPTARTRTRVVPDSLWFEFTKPIAYLADSLGLVVFAVGDSDTVAAAVMQSGPRELSLHPAVPFPEGTRCRAVLPALAIRDDFGNPLGDSTLVVEFAAWATDSLGTLTGRAPRADEGTILIRVLALPDREAVADAVADRISGSFEMSRLPAAKYVLEVIQDRDRSGGFSYGRVRPYEPAEPFWISPDTVTIRARWEYETDLARPDEK